MELSDDTPTFEFSTEGDVVARKPPGSLPDYDLLRYLGGGAFGEVWLGRSRKLDTLCAVKLLPEGERARVELAGARSFTHHSGEHPHLVRVLHMGETPGCLYYVLELADPYQTARAADPVATYKARTLAEDLRREGPMSLVEAVTLCRDILSGIATLHAAGLLHRDIKPSNVISVDGIVKLTDISLVIRQEDVRSGGGTPAYAPPGLVRDRRGDLYCLGVSLWELVSGRVEREYPADCAPEKLEELRRLGPFLERACSPDPADRFDSCTEFARGLDEVIGDDALEEVGPYRVLRRLDRGESGMGVVYLAEPRDDMKRRVALKLVKAGMDTETVLRRFQLERQLHLSMSHPAIATAFEAGQTKHGRPYFAMEYVPGALPITEYCDRERLDIKERLKIFQEICRGLAHAHDKRVIHRDVKASNVLVRKVDGKPVVKLIDFGVARPLERGLTERTVTYTEDGEIVGTPEYMSPEQAEPASRKDEAEAIDYRADIYSLGVLLYELLVGELPLRDLRNDAPEEIRRRVREEEPLPPSKRWKRLNPAVRSQRAEARSTTPVALAKELEDDLDNITQRAMEKERARRYEKATDLAEHVQLYLEDQPVPVRAPSMVYRLRKYVRRHHGPIVAAAAVIGALALGLLGTTWFAIESGRMASEIRRNAAEILRLADMKELNDRELEARALWPVSSESTGDLRRWLQKAKALVARLERHQESLRELRAQALPQVSGSGESKFLRPEDDLWHDRLEKLVRDIQVFAAAQPEEPLGPTIAGVTARLQFAETVRQRTIDDHLSTWEKAIASIANEKECPAYNGLKIERQEGLIPIGRDPESELWEFADLLTGDMPERGADSNLVVTDSTGLVFVLVPGGTFRMGAERPALASGGAVEEVPKKLNANVDPGATADEGPVDEVLLEPFFLSKYELTQGVWQRFTGENPSAYDPGWSLPARDGKPRPRQPTMRNPVEQVSWEDCREVLWKLGLVLPTEAQWEYACRSGTATPWWTGESSESLEGAANVADQALRRLLPDLVCPGDWPSFDDGYEVHAPVGSYQANPFGLHDVHGNVWEWCRDVYMAYDSSPPSAGDGERRASPETPESESREAQDLERVYRGGSFYDSPGVLRSSNRSRNPPKYVVYSLGVRPARELVRD